MIVASMSRYVPVMPGYLVLQDTEELYYYVHKTFFEQAVVIEDRYKDNIETLQKQIGGNPDFIAVRKFTEYAPRPINIMGYFLALLKEDIEDYQDIIGAMDVIGTALNLRNLIKQPASIRQSVSFSVSIKNEYQDSWDLFFQNCYDYDTLKSMLSGGYVAPAPAPAPRRQTQTTQAPVEEEPAYDDEDDEDYFNPDGSINMEKYNAYMEAEAKKIDAQLAEEAAKKKAEEATKETESAPVKQESTVSDGGSGMGVIANARKRRSI